MAPSPRNIGVSPMAGQIEVHDSVGNLFAAGDQVTLINDLRSGARGKTLKRGTLIKSIRLTDNPRRWTANMKGSGGWCCAPNLSARARIS